MKQREQSEENSKWGLRVLPIPPLRLVLPPQPVQSEDPPPPPVFIKNTNLNFQVSYPCSSPTWNNSFHPAEDKFFSYPPTSLQTSPASAHCKKNKLPTSPFPLAVANYRGIFITQCWGVCMRVSVCVCPPLSSPQTGSF